MKRIDLFSRTTLTRAAAELVLIVTGILIALAVDGALSQRAERAAARESLELVREDLVLLREQADEFRAFNQEQLAATVRVTRLLAADAPVPRTTQMWQDLVDLTSRRTLRLPRAAWDELVGTGNLRLLDDRELRRDLVRFYETVARDELIVSQNNAQFVDQLGLGVLVGEGLVLSHHRLDAASAVPLSTDRSRLMLEAGIATGPTFRGRIWSLAPGHPDRVRAESIALAISAVAANGVALSRGMLTDVEGLIDRIDLALTN